MKFTGDCIEDSISNELIQRQYKNQGEWAWYGNTDLVLKRLNFLLTVKLLPMSVILF